MATTGGKTRTDADQRHRALMDERPLTTACAFCAWTYTGTAAEGRQEAAAHRASTHPAAQATRRRRGMLHRFHAVETEFRDEGLVRAAEVAALHARREGRAA